MLKFVLLKLLVGLAILLSLLGGLSATGTATSAKVAPTQHLLACGTGMLPPCD